MNKIIASITALCLITGGYLRAQTIPTDPQLRTGKLPNGLTYFIRHNERPKDRADFYLVQKVGSVLEEEDQRGLAHFLEHMAFNGTKHFPGNTMVSELEKKGIKFGSNINASTSYDQTIYKLNDIPVTREGITDTALLVLHDWSGFLTLDENEIDKERGVVREEWRTRSTANLRVLENGIMPIAFAGSPYANRIPIGKLDVINNFKPQQLKDYYKKWYRPDLQAVIIVGDIDVKVIEAKFKKLFADVPAPVNPAKRINYSIPNNTEPLIAMASDPELKKIECSIFWKKDNYPTALRTDVNYFNSTLTTRMIESMLQSRLANLHEKTKLPWSSMYFTLGDYMFIGAKQALSLNIDPVDADHLGQALEAGFLEAERLRRYGFSKEEFEECKKGMVEINKMDMEEPDKAMNYQFVQSYIELFTQNRPVPTSKWRNQAVKQFLNRITLDSINKEAKALVTDSNMVITVKYPENASSKISSMEALVNAWKNVKKESLDPYILHKQDYTLPNINPVRGKVVKKENKPFGFTQWTLSNGAKVQYKRIDDPEQEVIMYAYSPGGYAEINLKDLPSARLMPFLTSQKNIEDSTLQSNADLRVNEYDETIAGKAHSSKDVKTMLLMTYLKMTTFKKDTLAFERLIEDQMNGLRNDKKQPKDYYGDTLIAIMSNNNPRSRVSLKDSAYIPKMDYDKMVTLFKQRYQDASDFIFFIAGSMREDSMQTLVETWIGSLPSIGKKEKVIDHHIYSPEGIVKKHFYMPMKTPQTTVTIGYTGKLAMNVQNRILMDCLSGVLRIIYDEKLREEEGGTYGASVTGNIFKEPTERFIFQVNFDTDPSKKDKLISIVYDELNKIKQQSSKDLIEKVKLHLLKNFQQQSSEKDATYWATQAFMLYVYNIDGRIDYEKAVNAVTPEMISDFARKIFNQGNLIEVVMDPQNINPVK